MKAKFKYADKLKIPCSYNWCEDELKENNSFIKTW